MDTQVQIKGIQDGLLVSLPEGAWEEVFSAILLTVDERLDFFRGARIALQVSERDLGATELSTLRAELGKREIMLWAVLGESAQTRAAAADLGLALELPRHVSPEPESVAPREPFGEEAVLLSRTLRSGQSLRYPGHVVVIGDVNPGAEIIAGGNVVVWGRLRGVVHAGAAGDEQASVCALDLAPTQLRIAGQIAVSPDRRGRPKPEMARIRDGQLVAETWSERSS